MEEKSTYTLINQQNGHLAFKVFSFSDASYFDHLQRNNFYSVIWVLDGEGLLKADFSEYLFSGNNLFSFAPYQPFMFSAGKKLQGWAIQFHPDFYCIHRNPQETGCDKVLFNNIYEKPFLKLDDGTTALLDNILAQLIEELKNADEHKQELLIPYLKIFLVTAARKKTVDDEPINFIATDAPFTLRTLKDAIEKNYKQKHAAGDYAEVLDIPAATLARLVKNHYNKTLTELIAERIMIEAKRELYLTSKTVKEIAFDLGYADEFYFSRFFKNNAGTSPQMYRETVGFGKAETAQLN